jgi:hypothetical protein
MFIPPIAAALTAMIINGEWAAPTAYVAGRWAPSLVRICSIWMT